jgi:hypothetical protein
MSEIDSKISEVKILNRKRSYMACHDDDDDDDDEH